MTEGRVWRHMLCERCWFEGEGLTDDGALRMPVRLKELPGPEICCRCGGVTIAGIYIRADQDDLNCGGQHTALTSGG